MVALSESVLKMHLQCPQAENWRWRHIRLANYYGTISGSHGRSFRIRHKDVRAAPSGGGLTMTSYLVGNKTSLSRKHTSHIKFAITIKKLWSLFQNPSCKIAWSASLAEKSRWRHIRLAIKPRYLGNHASQINVSMGRYPEVMVALSESFMKKGVQHPLAEDWRWPHIRLAIKPRYLGNIHRR